LQKVDPNILLSLPSFSSSASSSSSPFPALGLVGLAWMLLALKAGAGLVASTASAA